MSYNSNVYYAEDLGPYDIEALQYLYGVGTGIVEDSSESLTGTTSADLMIASSASGATLRGDYGADTMSGGAGGDLIYGNHNSDSIDGGSGGDVIYGGQNDGDPRPDAYGEWRMQDGVETIDGGAGADTIYGNYGNETIDGGAGNDVLYGGQNEDNLNGNGGDDSLYGNRDDDTLTGGDGADTFFFASNGGNDVITDFSGDYIYIQSDINGTGIQSFLEVADRISTNSAGQAVIDLGDGHSVTIANISGDQLDIYASVYLF